MSMVTKGILFEYGLSLPPLALVFDFNPQTISRSRTVSIKTGNAPGARLGFDFLTPLERAVFLIPIRSLFIQKVNPN